MDPLANNSQEFDSHSLPTGQTAECTHMKQCEMYRHFALADSVEVWKVLYCRGDYSRCVRYQLSCKGERVPSNLMPNGTILNV